MQPVGVDGGVHMRNIERHTPSLWLKIKFEDRLSSYLSCNFPLQLIMIIQDKPLVSRFYLPSDRSHKCVVIAYRVTYITYQTWIYNNKSQAGKTAVQVLFSFQNIWNASYYGKKLLTFWQASGARRFHLRQPYPYGSRPRRANQDVNDFFP